MKSDLFWTALVELLWPAVCPVCERECLEGGKWICDRGPTRQALMHAECLSRLRSKPALPVEPSPWRQGVPLTWAFRDSPEWFRVLHAIKYGGRWPLLDLLAGAAAFPRPLAGARMGSPILVPLPDDPFRRRERGGSVTGRLAEGLALRWGATRRPDLLRRRGPRPAQARLHSPAERARNVRGLFRPGPLDAVSLARPLVLVEDQITTGSTLREALPALGARGHRIAVFALAAAARAPRRLAA